MKTVFIILLFFLFGCSSKEKPINLGEIFDVNSIQKVKMFNYYGDFYLNKNQLISFKKDLGNAIIANQTLKLGGLGFLIFFNNDSSMIYSNSNSSFLECPPNMFQSEKESNDLDEKTRYFSTAGINYQNYKSTK